jgi:carbamoyl-phosphate synthase small subunit
MPIHNQIPATLVLEDGTVFRGRSFGATGEVAAEIIFNTGMTGYQEVLTDPSYRGQMVVMTYPQIGNYGINELDNESPRPQVSAFIVKEVSGVTSNWRSEIDLGRFLEKYGIPGIEGVDTRALVLHLRNKGAMRAILSTERHDVDELVKAVGLAPSMEGANLVYDVTAPEKYQYSIDERLAGLKTAIAIRNDFAPQAGNERYKVVAFDYGVKENILTLLAEQNFDLTVVPAHTSAEDVLALKPDGVFLSNGPGDPAALSDVVQNVQKLVGKTPMFGICLGHQILALANGGKTYKLKFGHHGSNHPVKDLLTNKVEITSQNHGFCVDADSLPSTCQITHMNLNDDTVEGFKDEERGFYAIQYHPEAAPGPHDSAYLFRRFREWIAARRG